MGNRYWPASLRKLKHPHAMENLHGVRKPVGWYRWRSFVNGITDLTPIGTREPGTESFALKGHRLDFGRV